MASSSSTTEPTSIGSNTVRTTAFDCGSMTERAAVPDSPSSWLYVWATTTPSETTTFPQSCSSSIASIGSNDDGSYRCSVDPSQIHNAPSTANDRFAAGPTSAFASVATTVFVDGSMAS